MSLTVLVVAGLPALLVFSFGLVSDSRTGLIGVAAAAVAFGVLTGAANFAVLDTFCVLIGFFLGIGRQNRRREQNGQSNASSDQLVTRNQASTVETGAHSKRIRTVVLGSTAASGARVEPKMPKAIWHDTSDQDKVKLEKEFEEWRAH